MLRWSYISTILLRGSWKNAQKPYRDRTPWTRQRKPTRIKSHYHHQNDLWRFGYNFRFIFWIYVLLCDSTRFIVVPHILIHTPEELNITVILMLPFVWPVPYGYYLDLLRASSTMCRWGNMAPSFFLESSETFE